MEISEQPVKIVTLRDVIAIDDGNKIAAGMGKRIVQIAGFGTGVVLTSEIATAERTGKSAHLGSVSIVEQPGLVLVVDFPGGEKGAAHHRQAFVVRRHEHVDLESARRRRGRAGPNPPGQKECKKSGNNAEDLRQIEQGAEREMVGVEYREAPGHIGERRDAVEHGEPNPPLVAELMTLVESIQIQPVFS